jgi:hypothetical protein
MLFCFGIAISQDVGLFVLVFDIGSFEQLVNKPIANADNNNVFFILIFLVVK